MAASWVLTCLTRLLLASAMANSIMLTTAKHKVRPDVARLVQEAVKDGFPFLSLFGALHAKACCTTAAFQQKSCRPWHLLPSLHPTPAHLGCITAPCKRSDHTGEFHKLSCASMTGVSSVAFQHIFSRVCQAMPCMHLFVHSPGYACSQDGVIMTVPSRAHNFLLCSFGACT